MRLYRIDIWIRICDREGLAEKLSLPSCFSGEELSEKLGLSYDPVYGDREDMMHFYHGHEKPQAEDIIDYDEQKIRGIAPYLDSGGISVFPFTGEDIYARYLFRDGQIRKIEASIIWHVPDAQCLLRGDPAFPEGSVEMQIEAVKKKHRKLFPGAKEEQKRIATH